jgi:hypothetical protein
MPRNETTEGPAPEEQEDQTQSAQGPDSGSGTGSGTPASTNQEGRSWSRGDDPEAANEELLKANRGSTGGELNVPPPKTTPQG